MSNIDSGNRGSGETGQESNSNSNSQSSVETGQPGNDASPQHTTPPGAPGPGAPARLDFTEILTAINAMPEKVVSGLREATQAARAPVTSQTGEGSQTTGNDAQNGTQTASQASQSQPGRKTFRDWWFN